MKLGIPPMESAWKCSGESDRPQGKKEPFSSSFQMECEKELFWMLQSMHTLMHTQGCLSWIRRRATDNSISMSAVGSWHLQTLALANHWVKGCMYPSGVPEENIKVKSFTQSGLGADREPRGETGGIKPLPLSRWETADWGEDSCKLSSFPVSCGWSHHSPVPLIHAGLGPGFIPLPVWMKGMVWYCHLFLGTWSYSWSHSFCFPGSEQINACQDTECSEPHAAAP